MTKPSKARIQQAVDLYCQLGSKTLVADAMNTTESSIRRYLKSAGVNTDEVKPVQYVDLDHKFKALLDEVNQAALAPSDPIEVRRLRDDNAALKVMLRNAERRAAIAEDIRAGVLGLTEAPLVPTPVPPKGVGGKDDRSVILHLSDIHYGETVDIDEMDGVNRYNSFIAKQRLWRFFNTSSGLMTKHWSGPRPQEIILCLGGDLISGMIHAELLETNYPAIPAAVREVAEIIAGGIAALRERVGCPIRVYGVPGNHGRMTVKPQSKGRAAGSFDTLVMDFIEATLKNTKAASGVTFYRPNSPDAYFSVYGWQWLLTHGDTMGGRGGGTGFIGPMASIIKGHRKLVDTYWRTGRPVHYVLTAHYHTTGKTAFGWGNGSVIGYGEFARDLRADPEPAKQNMLTVHPRLGVIDEQPLYLGAPDEGSLYLGPASLVRPVFDAAE